MAAIRREIKEVERQFDEADKEYAEISKKLKAVTQERDNTEEELMSSNVRLKQLLGELQAQKELTAQQTTAVVADNRMTMDELSRKVETALLQVLEERFRDEAFTSAITEQSSLSVSDKVRVEFDGDEVFWSLHDNYTFEMLLQDAARYWDVAAQDVILVDERGAIWPNDAYCRLEMQRNAASKIAMKIKPVAVAVDEDVEMFGREGEEESEEEEEEFDQSVLAIAASAEDELLLAQAKGGVANLNTKQKLALRRKLRYELYWFLAFVVVFVWSLYGRRTVREAYLLQEAISTAFVEENFGDYNEKAFLDIATADEMFEWMEGPLQEGLFPDSLYNGADLPSDREGYVMTYNRVVGKIRLRQLRIAPDSSCRLSTLIFQDDTTSTGMQRHRQFVDHCYGPYEMEHLSNRSFGPAAGTEATTEAGSGEDAFDGSGFTFKSAAENSLAGVFITGPATGAEYDGSGFVRDLDPGNRSAYIEALNYLKSNLWVDVQTRAVIISLNTYNGNYNYYCISQFMLEYTQGGTVVPNALNRILRIDLYEPASFENANRILFLYIPEALTYLGTLALLLHFLYRLYRVRRVTRNMRNLFRDSWTFVDMALLSTLITTIALRLIFFFSIDRTAFDPFPVTPDDQYREMTALAREYSAVFIVDAFTILVLVIKSLKYFSLQKDLMLLQHTLQQAISDLSFFLLMLLFLFAGFIIMGLNIFGMQAQGFKSLRDTLGTLFLILLGEFDFEEMREVSPLWSIVFFVFFVVFMFFIVLNIFLAILNDAYTVVHTNVVWDELERRKPLSLRERFEVRRAQWRERRNINRMRKMKRDKVKAARKAKKEFDKKQKERSLLDRIGRRKRKAEAEEAKKAAEAAVAAGADLEATSSTKRGGDRRTLQQKQKPF